MLEIRGHVRDTDQDVSVHSCWSFCICVDTLSGPPHPNPNPNLNPETRSDPQTDIWSWGDQCIMCVLCPWVSLQVNNSNTSVCDYWSDWLISSLWICESLQWSIFSDNQLISASGHKHIKREGLHMLMTRLLFFSASTCVFIIHQLVVLRSLSWHTEHIRKRLITESHIHTWRNQIILNHRITGCLRTCCVVTVSPVVSVH